MGSAPRHRRRIRRLVAFARSLPAGGKVQVVAFKGIVDGVMATQSAALLEPYADLPATRGPLYWTASELTPRIIRANQAGFAVALHAIGDRAVRTSLDAFEAARKTVSPSRMNRIEHASLIDEADIPRFAALGVAASVQPI